MPIQARLAGQLVLVAFIAEGFSIDTFALPYLWLALGFISYPLIKFFAGRGRECGWLTYGLALVLVFWGTLAQVNLGLYKAQNEFFRSFLIYWQPAGSGLKIPVFPGGYLVGGVLVLNLIASQIRRFSFTASKAGLWMVHVGLILLLVLAILAVVLVLFALVLLAAAAISFTGCSSGYYSAYEKIGGYKRDLLKKRVAAARDDQQAAVEGGNHGRQVPHPLQPLCQLCEHSLITILL